MHSFILFFFFVLLFACLALTVVLSAERVEQMTKTYNDIDVVTHLLGEVSDVALSANCDKVLCQVYF